MNTGEHYAASEGLVDKAHKVQGDEPDRATFLMSSAQVHATLATAGSDATDGHVWTPESTLGDIAKELTRMKAGGMTRGSVLYVVDRVWFEEAQEEAERTLKARALINESRREPRPARAVPVCMIPDCGCSGDEHP